MFSDNNNIIIFSIKLLQLCNDNIMRIPSCNNKQTDCITGTLYFTSRNAETCNLLKPLQEY